MQGEGKSSIRTTNCFKRAVWADTEARVGRAMPQALACEGGGLENPFACSEVQGLFHSDGTILNQQKVRKPYSVSTPVSSCRLLNLSMAKDGSEPYMGFLARTQLSWHGGNFPRLGEES